MLVIVVFHKCMYAMPIKSKQEGDVASGMIECSNKMGRKPDKIYTDDEGSLNKEAIQKYLKDENMEHHRTRAHPNLSKRAIRTSKACYIIISGLKQMKKRRKEHPTAGLHIRKISNL